LRTALADHKVAAVPHLVINRIGSQHTGVPLAELEHLAGMPFLTVRGDATGVMDATNNGVPLREQAPGSPAVEDIGRVLETLLHHPARPRHRPSGKSWMGQLRGLLGG
jgi:Flp pilus assembly CpaE family ATPase